MNPRTTFHRAFFSSKGSVLITAAVVATILAMIVSGYLSMLSFQYSLDYRAHYWAQTLYLAEGGIDYGIKELNYDYLLGGSGFTAAHGWSNAVARLPGSPSTTEAPVGYTKTVNNFADANGNVIGDFTVQVYNIGTVNTAHPILVSQATITVRNTKIARTVRAISQSNSQFVAGILVKSTIQVRNVVDSYDSTDPLNPLKPIYNPFYAKSNAIVATNGPASGVDIDHIRGSLMVGSGSYTNGTVSGTFSNSFHYDITDVSLPADFGSNGTLAIPATATISGSASSLTPPVDFKGANLNNTYTITGHVRIYVTNSFNGNVYLAKGGKADIYVGASSINVNDIENLSGDPWGLIVYGLPTCTSIVLNSHADLAACVYAPEADVTTNGNPNYASGSIVANSFRWNGSGGAFHFDEALKKTSPIANFGVISWEEILPTGN